MVTSVGIVFRSKAEQKVADAGFDPARLPPGQYLTEKWPVLHAGEVPRVDIATWDIRIFGEVEQELRLSWDELRALPATEVVTDIHCVTRWSRFDQQFKGVHWRELAKLCNPKPNARFAIAHAEHGFTANVPLAALEDENALIVDRLQTLYCPTMPFRRWPSSCSRSRAAGTSSRTRSGASRRTCRSRRSRTSSP